MRPRFSSISNKSVLVDIAVLAGFIVITLVAVAYVAFGNIEWLSQL